MSLRRRLLFPSALLLAGGLFAWSRVEPSADRDWSDVHARAPSVTFDGDAFTIDGVRAFTWPADTAAPPAMHWDTRTYSLADVSSVWYVVAPFETDWRGPAHAFLSFGFDDGRYLSVSVEARRERGEAYSMIGGMLKRYELIYVLGDERDLIGSRVLRQDDATLLYPIRTTRAGARALLADILERVARLERRPEWYGTLRNNCTTAILNHAGAVLDEPIGWGLRVLLPGYSDALALERGLIDTDLSIDDARRRFRINEKVRRWADAPDFSVRVRAPG